jgi:hypothetical protein
MKKLVLLTLSAAALSVAMAAPQIGTGRNHQIIQVPPPPPDGVRSHQIIQVPPPPPDGLR